MSLLEAALIVAAGLTAGAMNAAVGSGTLVSFPTLIALGFPPVVANVSNTIGLVPGSTAGAWAYRRELAGQRTRLLRLLSATVLGALVGAVLLLTLPESAFEAIVPGLILLGCVLVVAQPRISARMARRATTPGSGRGSSVVLWVLVFTVGIYGGYFGASQGVLLIAIMGVLLGEGLQRLNAAKNVLAGAANLTSGLVFAMVANVNWAVVGAIATGSLIGGLLGGGLARRMPDWLLRGLIVVVGLVAVVVLVGGE